MLNTKHQTHGDIFCIIVRHKRWYYRTDNALSDNGKLVSNKINVNESGEFRSSFLFHSVNKVNLGFKVVSLENDKINFLIEIFSEQNVVDEQHNKENENWIELYGLLELPQLLQSWFLFIYKMKEKCLDYCRNCPCVFSITFF